MSNPSTTKTENEATLNALADAVLANRRLAWKVVSAWLKANGYVLVEEAEEYKKLARLLPNLPILETYKNRK